MSDYIDRQAAIDALFELYEYQRDIDPTEAADLVRQGVYLAEKKIEQLPSVQPDHVADIGKKVDGDCISRQAAIAAITDELMPSTPLSAVIRAKNRLKELPSVQPDHNADSDKKVSISCGQENDLISRQAAIDALARMMPRSYTPDGSHPADEEIFRAQEVFADCIEALEILPSAQSEERKKGAWILGFDNQYLEKYYFCSKCGSRKYMEDKPLDNFCANCGADMRGEQKAL